MSYYDIIIHNEVIFMNKNLFTNELKDVIQDFGEITIDNSFEFFSEVPILKEIPILKTVLALKNTYIFIRERLFFNKLYYFLKEIDSIPQKNRIIFFEKNSKKIDKLEEKIIFYLENMETSEKVPFLSNLFKNLISEKITLEEFNRFSYILNSLSYSDIESFIFNPSNIFDESLASILYSKGLITFKSKAWKDLNDEIDIFYPEREYTLTLLGENLKKNIT